MKDSFCPTAVGVYVGQGGDGAGLVSAQSPTNKTQSDQSGGENADNDYSDGDDSGCYSNSREDDERWEW